MSEWQPIATCPVGRPVELGTFPISEHKTNVTICTSVDGLRLAYPTATHWREMSPGTAQAVFVPKPGRLT